MLTVPLILLVALAMTPVMIAEDALARYQRHTGGNLNQAASVSNSCLNPVSNSNTNDNMISNGNCGGTISQQGKSGQASTPTTVQNANPNVEVQRSTTTAQPSLTSTGGNCTACFDPLSATQQSELLDSLSHDNIIPPTVSTIAQLCEFLRGLSVTDLVNAILVIQNELPSLPDHPVNVTTSLSIEKCLTQALVG
jgi:hypothetical protein